MRILYVHQYFRTPAQGGAIRSWHLARGMVAAGHEVIMITAHAAAPRRETVEGIDLRYVQVPYSNEMSYGERIIAFGKFVWQVHQEIKSIDKIDVCYLTSTPLTVGLIGLWVRRKRRWPYLFEVRDLWPEAPIQMGAIRSAPVRYGLRWLEQRIYDRAEAIVALSPGMKAGVLARSPQALVEMIPNMADLSFFASLPDKQVAEELLSLPSSFRVLYAGTMGRANRLERLLRLAAACRETPIEWVLIGDGSEKEHLQSLAEDLPQVRFVDPQNKESIRCWHAASDAVYVSFGPQPVLETTSPNKFFDGLAAGKVMMVNVGGWMRELIEVNRCGFYADPDAPEIVREQLLAYLGDQQQVTKASQRSRDLAERDFGVDRLVGKVLRLLEEVSQESPS